MVTDAGDSGGLIFDDAVFSGCEGNDDIIQISLVGSDNGAFNSKFIILCFFAFSQEDDELTFLFKDERFYSVILA